MCQMQNTCIEFCRPSIITSWVDTFYWLELVWNQTQTMLWVTCHFKFWRKKSHVPIDSLLATAKTIGWILLLPSRATATRKIPLYLQYNHFPSTWTTVLQYWNPSIHGLKLQKIWWNMNKPFSAWPWCGGIGRVSFSTIIPGRNCYIA